MIPRLLEIQRESEQVRQVIADALARLASLDAEYKVIFETLKVEAPAQDLTFHDGDEIDWVVGRAKFSPATFRLIRELWESKTKFVSKEEIREYVQHDEESKDGSVRKSIFTARKEIAKTNFPYAIETVKAKGYKLIEALPSVTKRYQKSFENSKKR